MLYLCVKDIDYQRSLNVVLGLSPTSRDDALYRWLSNNLTSFQYSISAYKIILLPNYVALYMYWHEIGFHSVM